VPDPGAEAPGSNLVWVTVCFSMLLRKTVKVLDYYKNCLVWLLFDCIACRKFYILLFVLRNFVEY
jgi:hypothetical protein